MAAERRMVFLRAGAQAQSPHQPGRFDVYLSGQLRFTEVTGRASNAEAKGSRISTSLYVGTITTICDPGPPPSSPKTFSQSSCSL